MPDSGGDNNLGIIVGKYDPGPNPILCSSPMPFTGGCRDIITGIPVDRLELLFGPTSPPAIVKLPAQTSSREYTLIR